MNTPQQNDIGLKERDIAAVRLPLEKASLLPAKAYRDPTIFELEKQRIFKRAWLPVCHVSQLPEAGSYVARKLVGESVMALRDRDDGIRVMSNVCRHRNTTLTTGSGKCKGNRMMCPYHGWTYGTDGKLLAAPFMNDVQDFDRKGLKLPEFRSEIWHGFVFVNFDDTAESLASQLEGLEPNVAPYRFEDMEVVELKRAVMPWNWKISLENFSEAYHQPWVHPETAEHAFPAKTTEYRDVTGAYGLFHIFEKNKDPIPTFFPPVEGLPAHMLTCATVFNVYPYMHSLADPATPLWLDFNIKSEREHEVIWSVLLPKGAKDRDDIDELMGKFRSFIEPILMEDFGICVGVGDGVDSDFIKPGRYSHMEKTLHQFHNWWLDLMLSEEPK